MGDRSWFAGSLYLATYFGSDQASGSPLEAFDLETEGVTFEAGME